MTDRYGMRAFTRNGEPMVEGLDGTVVPIWKALQDRKVGLVKMREEMVTWLAIQEDYLLRKPRDRYE